MWDEAPELVVPGSEGGTISMRRIAIMCVLGLLAAGLSIQLIPSGAGQHYSETTKQTVEAVGNIVGGSSSASAQSAASADGGGMQVAAGPLSFEVKAHLDQILDISQDPPGVTPGLVSEVCLKVWSGSSQVQNQCGPGLVFVDPLASVGTVFATLGGTEVALVLTGQGSPTIAPERTLEIDPVTGSITGGVRLVNRRQASASGVINGPFGGGAATGGGKMSSDIETVAASDLGTVSGGGSLPSGADRSTFSLCFGGACDGTHLTWRDHAANRKIDATAGSLLVAGNKATVRGVAKVDGISGCSFELKVSDNNTSSTKQDTIYLNVTGPAGCAYTTDPDGNERTISGGNLTVS